MKRVLILILFISLPRFCIGFSEPIESPAITINEACSFVLNKYAKETAMKGIQNKNHFVLYAEYGTFTNLLEGSDKLGIERSDILKRNETLSDAYGWLVVVLRSPDLTQSEMYFVSCRNSIHHLLTSD